MITDNNVPEEVLVRLVEDAIKKKRCVPVVGAGASISAGGPSWKEYLQKMAAGLPKDLVQVVEHESADPLEIATSLSIERKRMRMAPVEIDFKGFSAIHKTLAAWRCPLYLTTNFDRGLERAIEADVEQCAVFTNDDLGSLNLLNLPDKPVVVKLCSSSRPGARAGNPGALTREDFALLLHRDKAALELLKTLLRCTTVVFVGCSMRDPLITSALDQSYASGIGYGKHIAFLPSSASTAQVRTLAELDIDTLGFELTGNPSLLERVTQCTKRIWGDYRLLVFEPSRSTKARQILEAIQRISKEDQFARIGFITSNPALAQEIPVMSRELVPNIDVDVIEAAELSDTASVVAAAQQVTSTWSALFAPFEYTISEAAAFAKEWNSVGIRKLGFHTRRTAAISRDKREFRTFLLEKFRDHDIISPTPFKILKVDPEMTADALFSEIKAHEWNSTRIVVKPCDASGSIGVRPLDLKEPEKALLVLDDFLNILRSMRVEPETAHCDVSEILAEERHEGEEFSVESRRVRGQVVTVAIHWKIDIDKDSTRFFERLFVTLPRKDETYRLLENANNELLQMMNVGDGVFHAEYRVDLKKGRVHPLEVGLRPGGGMVSSSVYESAGVDMFEAAVRCAIQTVENRPTKQRTVATGLVFAKGSGVLPSLRIKDGEKSWTVLMNDGNSFHELLRRFTTTVNRKDAALLLKKLLSRDSALCERTLSAFDPEAAGGVGLRASIKSVDVWIPPGTLVAEEESSYVAGLLAVASDGLSPDEAIAEAVACIELCLSRISCQPEPALSAFSWRSSRRGIYPKWWRDCTNRGFRSEIDSWTYSRALSRAVQGHTAPDLPSILDLGCGSGRPALSAIRDGHPYAGLDVDEAALADARSNIARIDLPKNTLTLLGDVLHTNWLDELITQRSQWDIVAANLPYLPAPLNRLDKDVDGGNEGLRYVPGRVLEVANEVNATSVVINVSSLCNLPEFAKRVEEMGYGVVRVVVTLAPLEEYSLSVFDYLERQSFARWYGGTREKFRQIIYGMELQRSRGISVGLMISQVETLLRPDANELGTMLVGTANW